MSTNNSETPRTDAEIDTPYNIHLMNDRAERHDEAGRAKFGLTLTEYVVPADFARQLERELTALNDGQTVVLPETLEHARAMYSVAVAALKSMGHDPEQQIRELQADRERIDRLATFWDSQDGPQPIMRGLVIDNPSGSFRAALDHAFSVLAPARQQPEDKA